MSKFATLTGTSAAGRSHQEIALQAVEAARMPVDIDDFTRSRRKCVVVLASNETGHASATNASMALTNNEDDSYMATQENSSASTNPQETTHTPGPWSAHLNTLYPATYDIFAVDGTLVAVAGECAAENEDDVCEPNALLIAAVPDLLAVAEGYAVWEADLVLNNAWDGDGGMPTLTQAQYDELIRLQSLRNAAIAKAKGGAR